MDELLLSKKLMITIEKNGENGVAIGVLENYNRPLELMLGFTLLLKLSIIQGSTMRSSSPNWKRHPPIWTPPFRSAFLCLR